MSAPNGGGSEDPGEHSPHPGQCLLGRPWLNFLPERVKEIVAALEVPFDPSQIEWRVMNTTKGQQPLTRSGRFHTPISERTPTD